MSLTRTLTGIAGKTASARVVLILAAATLLASCLAGWALWRLAGAGARCDTRLATARLGGDRVVLKLAADQQSALDVLRAEQDAELIASWARQPQVMQVEVTRWHTRWRAAGPAPGCAVTPEQVEAINSALRSEARQ